MSSITLPGLIDPHVHLRDPGQIEKEDFLSGTSAALAGGYVTVVDMPNNKTAITSASLLSEKIQIAKQKIVCDLGLNFGTLGDNLDQFSMIYDKVVGLKIYLNITYGGFKIDPEKLSEIYSAWESSKPIFLHSEDDVSDLVQKTLRKHPKPTHICHVSSAKELEFVMRAKDKGMPITCGVTPHHLFLNDKDGATLGPYGYMKPLLKSKKDQQFLWNHLDGFDIIESDHAPHTKNEKQSKSPPFGVPGLETTLPLVLTAQQEGLISMSDLIDKLHFAPARLIGLVPDKNTKIEVDMSQYEISNKKLFTKCGWSPFAGRKVVGKVSKVIIRGSLVYENGNVIAEAGSGKIIS